MQTCVTSPQPHLRGAQSTFHPCGVAGRCLGLAHCLFIKGKVSVGRVLMLQASGKQAPNPRVMVMVDHGFAMPLLPFLGTVPSD